MPLVLDADALHLLQPAMMEGRETANMLLTPHEGDLPLAQVKHDAGLTGRKIIVDTYGGMSRHGGGAFSGKDPTKVDRSAAYAARWVAKNLVAAGAATRLEVQLSYAIGVAEPTSILVESFGTGRVSEERMIRAIIKRFDLSPKGIVDALDLRRPIYRKTAVHGHFGRPDPDFLWELTSKAQDLRRDLGL